MAVAAPQLVRLDLPKKLSFLLDMHRYKVAYGGRGSAKSWSFASALLALGGAQRLRIVCAREVQKSIETSVYQLLCDRIRALGLSSFYTPSATEIVGANGTSFNFSGLAQHTVDSIKSWEGIDVVWVEEGQTVSKRSWDILIPTIRAENSEIWVTYNPDLETDATHQRFVVNTPPTAKVVKMNWSDNPWFPEVLNQERLYCLRTAPDDYDNIWEGNCRQIVAGAIYAREVSAMATEGRLRAVPYDPRLPVHTIWDLGWNDAMVIIMVQKPLPNVINIIGYIEDSFRTYAEYVADLDRLGYRWGDDWLPHDGRNRNPQTGQSPEQVLRGLGRRRVKVAGRTTVEDRIRAARMMSPRVYIDNGEQKRPTGYAGGKRLVDCLRNYRRNIPRTTGEPGDPVHDQYSHGADGFGLLAQVDEYLRNDNERRIGPKMTPYRSFDSGMGVLG